MSDIKWEEPPRAAAGRGADSELEAILDALRSRPGEWALIREGTHNSFAANIRNGHGLWIRGEFDATQRKRDDGKFDVWARYVGGQS